MDKIPVKVKQLPKHFDKWRNSTNNFAKSLCDKGSINMFRPNFASKKNPNKALEVLKTLPKVITRITRQMCDCDEVCTQISLSKFHLHKCNAYDIENLLSDDDYYYSSYINMKVVNGELIPMNRTIDINLLRQNIVNGIQDLCNNKNGSLRKLKCRAYEIIDQCGDVSECISILTYGVTPSNFRTCKNINFSTDLDNIGYKIGNPLILKNIRVEREIKNYPGSVSGGICSAQVSYIPLIILGIVISLSYYKCTRSGCLKILWSVLFTGVACFSLSQL